MRAAYREQRAVRLRLAGATFAEIAIDLGLKSPSSARDAVRILLFRLGVVSGMSLQQSLYTVQQLRRGTSRYDIDALVLHLRPEDGRVRETLSNSLARRLVSIWESYIPEARHPLQEEHDVIGAVKARSEPIATFLQDRLTTCSGFGTTDQVLWTDKPHEGDGAARISPMSYCGESLRTRVAYAAIGAAVHHALVGEANSHSRHPRHGLVLASPASSGAPSPAPLRSSTGGGWLSRLFAPRPGYPRPPVLEESKMGPIERAVYERQVVDWERLYGDGGADG